MATAEEKQDSALAAYRLAKDHEQLLAHQRGQSNFETPLVVDRDDIEFRDAIDTDVTAQVALSAALREHDD